MPIAFDSKTIYTSSGTISSPWNPSWTHAATIGGSAATNLGVVAAIESNGGSQTFQPDGVTTNCSFGGVSLSYLGSILMGNLLQAGFIAVWAGLGVVPATNPTVTFNLSSASSAFTNALAVSEVYRGVGSIGTAVFSQANDAAPNVVVSSAVGRLVWGLLANWSTLTYSSRSYTEQAAAASNPSFSAGDQAGASSVTFSATQSGSLHWAGAGFEMVPAAAGLIVPSLKVTQAINRASRY